MSSRLARVLLTTTSSISDKMLPLPSAASSAASRTAGTNRNFVKRSRWASPTSLNPKNCPSSRFLVQEAAWDCSHSSSALDASSCFVYFGRPEYSARDRSLSYSTFLSLALEADLKASKLSSRRLVPKYLWLVRCAGHRISFSMTSWLFSTYLLKNDVSSWVRSQKETVMLIGLEVSPE